MNMDTEQEFWAEVFRLVALETLPCTPEDHIVRPYFPPSPEPETIKLLQSGGDMYYTLSSDRQIAVDADHPDATGWKHD